MLSISAITITVGQLTEHCISAIRQLPYVQDWLAPRAVRIAHKRRPLRRAPRYQTKQAEALLKQRNLHLESYSGSDALKLNLLAPTELSTSIEVMQYYIQQYNHHDDDAIWVLRMLKQQLKRPHLRLSDAPHPSKRSMDRKRIQLLSDRINTFVKRSAHSADIELYNPIEWVLTSI